MKWAHKICADLGINGHLHGESAFIFSFLGVISKIQATTYVKVRTLPILAVVHLYVDLRWKS